MQTKKSADSPSIWLHTNNSWWPAIIITAVFLVVLVDILSSAGQASPVRIEVIAILVLFYALILWQYASKYNEFELTPTHLVIHNHWLRTYRREIPLEVISGLKAKYVKKYGDVLRVKRRDRHFARNYGLSVTDLKIVRIFCDLILLAQEQNSHSPENWMREPKAVGLQANLYFWDRIDTEVVAGIQFEAASFSFFFEYVNATGRQNQVKLPRNAPANMTIIQPGQKLSDPQFSAGPWLIGIANSRDVFDQINILELAYYCESYELADSVNFGFLHYDDPQTVRTFVASDIELGAEPLTLFVGSGEVRQQLSGILSPDEIEYQVQALLDSAADQS